MAGSLGKYTSQHLISRPKMSQNIGTSRSRGLLRRMVYILNPLLDDKESADFLKASNPQHSLQRPGASGASSLSADSIPLLDLAYVRLFVNLGRSKEAFFRRDFDSMAHELAQGTEIIQHADHSSDGHCQTARPDVSDQYSPNMGASFIKSEVLAPAAADCYSQQSSTASGQTSKRERHLRKAAYFAADSLANADRLGVTFADFDSRELPISSALCAFDCAQVLAEWVSTVQQRVGRYLGILGKNEIDFGQVPAIMLLEDDDSKLLDKIRDIINSAEMKLASNGNATSSPIMIPEGSYGSKILLVTAQMLQRAGVWPGMLTTRLV